MTHEGWYAIKTKKPNQVCVCVYVPRMLLETTFDLTLKQPKFCLSFYFI